MTPERWEQVKEAFQAALELDAQQRAIYLDGFCAAEPALRQEVESLLRHHHEAGTLMDHPAELAADLADAPDPWVGRNIGPYQTVAKIGEGGMGAVYRAIRVDDHYLKQVAIKLVRNGYASGQYLRRFRNERQIMATLDHPNIARLLDGGATQEGLPYLVMEFIDGQPIDEYCDSRKLNTVARLKMFCQVCAAVQYAHQNLIIHRDLKPGNILVTADGTPKLLDFGIAKLLEPELFFQTVDQGATLVKAMTPEYASPEQVRGESIATTSDVYTLGVVLYRLLTGHPPYRIDTTSPLDLVRAISESQPSKPSTVIDRVVEIAGHDGKTIKLTPENVSSTRESRPAVLRRRLSGDLDNIVLKALRKEPARRYASAEQFSEDIHRYLDGLPVLARADALLYRTGKFVRRHKMGVAAAVLIFVTLVGGIVATLRQARIAETQRARAEQRFNDVRKIAHDLMFDVHDSIQYLPGSTPARKLIVDDALAYLNSLAKEAGGDLSLQRELAQAYEKVGDVQGGNGNSNLGNAAGALDSYRKSMAIYEAVAAATPGDVKTQTGLSRSYLRMGSILEVMGKYDESLQYFLKALAIRKQLAANNPANAQAQSGLANAYDAIADVYEQQNEFDKSLESRRLSVAIYESLAAGDPKTTMYRRDAALEHKKIGGALEATGKLGPALQEYQYAFGVDQELAQNNPNDASAQRDVSIDRSSIGDVQFKSGDFPAALKWYRQALAIDEKLSAADPKDASSREYVVYDAYRVGDALLKTGDTPSALAIYKRAVTLAEENSKSNPGNMETRASLARVYQKLGGAYFSLASKSGRSEDDKKSNLKAAHSSYEKSLAIWLDLSKQGALRGVDRTAPDEVTAELTKCRSGLTEIAAK